MGTGLIALLDDKSSSHLSRSSGGKVSGQFSAKDLPGHTKLKLRTGDQLPSTSSKWELEERETQAQDEKARLESRTVLLEETSVLKQAKPMLMMAAEVILTLVSSCITLQ